MLLTEQRKVSISRSWIPSRPADNICAMMIVRRITGKIIRTACSVLYAYYFKTIVHSNTHTHEQFLKLTVDLAFVFFSFEQRFFGNENVPVVRMSNNTSTAA